MLNVYKREFKYYRKNLIIWSLSILVFMFVCIGKYEGLQSSEATIMDMFDKFPKIFLAVFGMVDLDITKLSGYYGIIFFYLIIMGAVYAGMLGTSLINKERACQTVEFIFVKPIKRQEIARQKLRLGITNCFLFMCASLFSTIIASIKFLDNDSILLIIQSHIILFIFEIIFLLIGLGYAMKKFSNKKEVSVITFGVLGLYFLYIIFSMFEIPHLVTYLSPLTMLDGYSIVNHIFESIIYSFGLMVIVIVFYLRESKQFEYKDLNV